jgi:hypothetical protein
MYFGNTAKTSQSYYQQRQQNNNPFMPLRIINIQNRNIDVPVPQTESLPQKDTKTMKWGEPTWFLLHTIAEKVRDESFQSIRDELLQIIYTICTNLPCPDCATHATAYLNGINFNAIQTKEQLKNMLFIFHNVVNARKGYPQFYRGDLDEKYSKAVTLNIILNFMKYFENKTSNSHMMANNLYRTKAITSIKSWFNNNMRYFIR